MRRCSHHHDPDSVFSFRGYGRKPNDSDTGCFVNVALEKFPDHHRFIAASSSMSVPNRYLQVVSRPAKSICRIHLFKLTICAACDQSTCLPTPNAKDERCALFLDSRGSEMPATCLNWKAVLHCEDSFFEGPKTTGICMAKTSGP